MAPKDDPISPHAAAAASQPPRGVGAGVAQGAVLMQSLNFEFLRPHLAMLADYGGFAERYTRSDPDGAALKLRQVFSIDPGTDKGLRSLDVGPAPDGAPARLASKTNEISERGNDG